MEFEQLYKMEGVGDPLSLGIDIKVHAPAGKTEGLTMAAYKAAHILEEQITRDFYANSKEAQEYAASVKCQLLACFPEGHIFARPIPNGYCDRACCEHKPWYDVTTRLGVIRIGWRKRVIAIDWKDSTVTAKAEALFPAEDVTKYERTIHAWGYEKAREYLRVLHAQPAGA